VAITANQTYVASYHTDSGNYSVNGGYFTSEVFSWPLRALSNAQAGGNGLYKYGATGFPTASLGSANYWVDVVFSQTSTDTVPPAVTNRTPAPNATKIATTTTVTATFSEPVQASSISFVLRTSGGSNVAGNVAYDAPSRTATFTPSAQLAFGSGYTATVSGAKDAAGNAMAAPVTWSFTTVACPCTIWPSTATPATANSGDLGPIEVGVKFRSDVDGFITGVRFYKGSGNTGPHIGNLWSAAGALLATATFSNETASGWQQVTFASPVAIVAGQTYVASYHTDSGNYSVNGGYFASEVLSWPLRALSNAQAGGNGLYKYGATGFPTASFGSSNYWVDVVFSPTP
jgi:hypothetical protein